MLIRITTILLLALFYIIYVTKMIIQRNKGIQTNQLGKNKENKQLLIHESLLRFFTFLIIIVQVLAIWQNWTMLDTPYRKLGLLISFVGVIIFLISIVTMRDSWRAGLTDDHTELITKGIYSFSRNPAFLGFDLLYIGILLSFFSYILLCITILTIVMLHFQILEEEKKLSSVFKEEYKNYVLKVRRYIGHK